jgi:hypothetical protein
MAVQLTESVKKLSGERLPVWPDDMTLEEAVQEHLVRLRSDECSEGIRLTDDLEDAISDWMVRLFRDDPEYVGRRRALELLAKGLITQEEFDDAFERQ